MTKDSGAETVKGADPERIHDRDADIAQDLKNSRFHLAGGLVGEGHGQDFIRRSLTTSNHHGHTLGEDPCLSRARSGKNQKGAV